MAAPRREESLEARARLVADVCEALRGGLNPMPLIVDWRDQAASDPDDLGFVEKISSLIRS